MGAQMNGAGVAEVEPAADTATGTLVGVAAATTVEDDEVDEGDGVAGADVPAEVALEVDASSTSSVGSYQPRSDVMELHSAPFPVGFRQQPRSDVMELQPLPAGFHQQPLWAGVVMELHSATFPAGSLLPRGAGVVMELHSGSS